MMFARYSEALGLVGILKCSNADFSSTGKFLFTHSSAHAPYSLLCLEFGMARIYRRHAKMIVRRLGLVPTLTFNGLTCL